MSKCREAAGFKNMKELEIFASRIPGFKKPKQRLEQYPTDSAVVAVAVWDALMRGLLETAVDLGCGTGRFAIAAAATGAYVLCVDLDIDAVCVAKETANSLDLCNVDFLVADATFLPARRRFAVAFQNPPFGIWSGRGVDIAFLETALQHADMVYTIHKLATLDYVRKAVEKMNAKLDVLETAVINIPPMYGHHKKKIHKVEIFLAVAARGERRPPPR